MVKIRERIEEARRSHDSFAPDHCRISHDMLWAARAAIRDSVMEALQALHGLPDGRCSTYLDGRERRLNFPASMPERHRQSFTDALQGLLDLLPLGTESATRPERERLHGLRESA